MSTLPRVAGRLQDRTAAVQENHCRFRPQITLQGRVIPPLGEHHAFGDLSLLTHQPALLLR